MPLIRPNRGDPVVVEDFGQPVYDRLTARRSWRFDTTATTVNPAGYITVNGGSQVPAPLPTDPRRYKITTMIAGSAVGQLYFKVYISGQPAGEFLTYVPLANAVTPLVFALAGPVILTTIAVQFSAGSVNGGFYILDDVGP